MSFPPFVERGDLDPGIGAGRSQTEYGLVENPAVWQVGKEYSICVYLPRPASAGEGRNKHSLYTW